MEYHWILLSVFLQLTFHPGKAVHLHLMRQFMKATCCSLLLNNKGVDYILMTVGIPLPLAQ